MGSVKVTIVQEGLLFGSLLALVSCSGASREQLDRCYGEGVRYYKEIGSWPTLSTGGSASDLIESHCRANPEMFADMPY